eukprot:5368584-Pyramimonas_sp.AAC.1
MALNTCGRTGRFYCTWRSPHGTCTTIDYVLARRRGGHGHSSLPPADLHANLGGYRDHRPLGTSFFAGARVPPARPAGRLRRHRGVLLADLVKLQQAGDDDDNSVPLLCRLLDFRAKMWE